MNNIAHIDIENSKTQQIITLDVDVIEYLDNYKVVFDISRLNRTDLDMLKEAVSTIDTRIESFLIGNNKNPEYGQDYSFKIDGLELIGMFNKNNRNMFI